MFYRNMYVESLSKILTGEKTQVRSHVTQDMPPNRMRGSRYFQKNRRKGCPLGEVGETISINDSCLAKITKVRVEKLQCITEQDAIAQGVDTSITNARESFIALWQSTHNDWDKNPDVWVVEFDVLLNSIK